MPRTASLAAALAFAALPAAAADVTGLPAGTYVADPSHAMLVFRIDHLGLQKFTASFDTLSATLEIDPAAPEAAHLTATVPVASLDLAAPPEGFLAALMVPPWFDAAAHPEMTFSSTETTRTGDNTADIAGTLTLNGIEGPLTLAATFNGAYPPGVIEPTPRMGFSATGMIDRTAFGMTQFTPPEGSTLGIGAEVNFRIEIEFSGPAPG